MPPFCTRDGSRTHTSITAQGILSPQCLPFHHSSPYDKKTGLAIVAQPRSYWAENGIRTRDPHLGKVMLYHWAISAYFCPAKIKHFFYSPNTFFLFYIDDICSLPSQLHLKPKALIRNYEGLLYKVGLGKYGVRIISLLQSLRPGHCLLWQMMLLHRP